MELFDYLTINGRSKTTLPWEEINLCPLSDKQHGVKGSNTKRFVEHLNYCFTLPNPYFYWLGDPVDHASPSGRRKIRNAEFYDSTVVALELKARKDLEEMKVLLKRTVGRTLFVLEGHHRYDFEDGTDTDTLLAEYLQAPFLGTSCIFQITFKKGDRHQNCQIYAHHGERSTVSPSLITRWMELNLLPNWPTIDIFNIAHCHQAAAVKKEGLIPMFGEVRDIKGKQRILAVTGGWLEGYVVGNKVGNRPQGTYVEKAQLAPTSIGGITISVTPVHIATHNYLNLRSTI